MGHPILNNLRNLLLYVSAWVGLGFLYFAILRRYEAVEFSDAVLQSIVNSVLLGALNIGTWFLLKYNRFEEKAWYEILINIAAGGIFIILVRLSAEAVFLAFIEKDSSFIDLLTSGAFNLKYIFGISIFLITAMFYYIISYYQIFLQNKKRTAELNLMLRTQELDNLKSQINPHFLFNSLNTISFLVYTNPSAAHESIVKLSDFFRYSLAQSKNSQTKLKNELENVFRYLDIEKIRFKNKLEIISNVDEKCNDYEVPVMILQPIFENAVKHGVYQSAEKVTVTLDISDKSDYFSIVVSNNFDPANKNSSGTGTGLKNIENRLQLTYGRNDLLSVTKTENVFTVKMFIPKILN
jgi:sensor histidine kinase YesM